MRESGANILCTLCFNVNTRVTWCRYVKNVRKNVLHSYRARMSLIGTTDSLIRNDNEDSWNSSSFTDTVMGLVTEVDPRMAEDDFPSTQNVSFISSVFGVPTCLKWEPVNHIYFQLANTFFFLSYLAPNGTYGILYLRCTLMIGCVFFALWGWAVLCSFDAFLWNATFVAINFVQVCVLLYHLRPVKFTREVEEVSLAL